MLVVQSISLDRLLNELNVGCKVSLQFAGNNRERVHNDDDQLRLTWLHFKDLQKLVDNLRSKLSESWTNHHLVDLLNRNSLDVGSLIYLSAGRGCSQQKRNNQV